MTNRINKDSILSACLIKQELQIDDFEKEIAALKKEIFAHDESPSQGNSGGAEKNELLQRYETELEFLKAEYQILEGLDSKKDFNEVLPGAVVVTNQRIFFVSVSIEQMEVNGVNIFGISTKAPIYEALRQKKKGDKFDFNKINYEILDVY